MLNKEKEILYLFAKEPWKKLTFTELMRISKKKSKSYLSSVIKKLLNDQLLNKHMVGHLPVYSLNSHFQKTQSFAGFILEYYGWTKKHIPYGDLQTIMNAMPTLDYVFIITGSYASNKQTKSSDIDIVLIIDDSLETKRVYAEITHLCEINTPSIHLYVFKNKEFLEMLKNKQGNYGKEIVKNNLILKGGQIYLKLLNEAIENGYNG